MLQGSRAVHLTHQGRRALHMPNTMFNKHSKSTTLRASLGTLLLAFAAGCSSSAGSSTTGTMPQGPAAAVDPIEAILGQKLTQPKTQCAFDTTSGIMTVA